MQKVWKWALTLLPSFFSQVKLLLYGMKKIQIKQKNKKKLWLTEKKEKAEQSSFSFFAAQKTPEKNANKIELLSFVYFICFFLSSASTNRKKMKSDDKPEMQKAKLD